MAPPPSASVTVTSPLCVVFRVTPLRRSSSLPAGLHLWMSPDLPPSPEATPTSILTFSWDADTQPEFVSLTPPATPTYGSASGMDLVGAGPCSEQWLGSGEMMKDERNK